MASNPVLRLLIVDDEQDVANALRAGLQNRGFAADIFYDPADRDARHVELYRNRLEVRDVRLPDCGHPVTGFLAEVGLLQRVVSTPRKERSTGRRSSRSSD